MSSKPNTWKGRVARAAVKASDLSGFSLPELLTVILLMALVASLVLPAFQHLVQAENATRAASKLCMALERARALAMGESTYVWVGFAEENPTDRSPVVVVSTVASKDGTEIFNPNYSASESNSLDPARLVQIGKLAVLENSRLADVSEPSGIGSSWECRPSVKRGPVLYRIGASTPKQSRFPFQYPVGVPVTPVLYVFNKTVQFNPRGEAVLNGSYSYVPWLEIAIRPAVASAGRESAVQVAGLAGNIQLYRR